MTQPPVPDLPRFVAPIITDKDIAWACDLLRLPATAFSGADGLNPRHEILESTKTLDIEACPGSGKTTLLVAKLAILSRKWADSRRGICVLSHTNAARHEIERGLGNAGEARRLLSYPHFVGTIHTFVNQFVALPWLRSLEFPVRVIDDQLCELHRRHLLTLGQFTALSYYVTGKENNAEAKVNVVAGWRTKSPRFDVVKMGGKDEFKDTNAKSSKQLRMLAEACAKDGYYCHSEMFMWANDLLNTHPEIRNLIRERFPMLFVDEVQDNSEEQSALLFKLLVDGKGSVIRQRFGDTNQAIYQHARETEGATTDCFPVHANRKDIPNSLRFGQQIANLANPLALIPQSLKGCGPPPNRITSETNGKHAIFMFEDTNIHRVLEAYAEYLLQVFSEKDLRSQSFLATAIGAVHKHAENSKKFPRSVGDYWPQYDPEMSRTEPTPKTFLQYVTTGRGRALLEKKAHDAVEAHHAVDAIATGVLRLVRLLNPTADLRDRRRKHHQVLELLTDDPDSRSSYLKIVTKFAIEESNPNADEWEKEWSGLLCKIAGAIAGNVSGIARTKEFLAWVSPIQESAEAKALPQKDNVFRHPAANPEVSIRVSSIHSAKGQTHTATLVLETPYHEHHLDALKPWLLGEKVGREKERGVRTISRLKQHYVAMTRPTHLLCLAMREHSLAANELDTLKNDRGWRVARIRSSDVEWL
jgi:DNA helicase II / ATP-dependent DNA helicase PcrA